MKKLNRFFDWNKMEMADIPDGIEIECRNSMVVPPYDRPLVYTDCEQAGKINGRYFYRDSIKSGWAETSEEKYNIFLKLPRYAR